MTSRTYKIIDLAILALFGVFCKFGGFGATLALFGIFGAFGATLAILAPLSKFCHILGAKKSCEVTLRPKFSHFFQYSEKRH